MRPAVDSGQGYLAAVAVAASILVGLSLLLNFVFPSTATWGQTTAHGWPLLALAVALAILVGIVMTFVVLLPFIAIRWVARVTGAHSLAYYVSTGLLTGVLLGGFTPMGVYGFVGAPVAGCAGGWTFWFLSVRPLAPEKDFGLRVNG